MLVSIRHCLVCGESLYFRVPLDYRTCSCGATKLSKDWDWNDHYAEVGIAVIDATVDDLYSDWGNGSNKYGVIKDDGMEKLD